MLVRLSALNWHAVRLYRLADRLARGGHHPAAAFVASINRVLTGVDIGVGAEIGDGLEIRHGNGLVIDPLARVGRDCTLYQQVTLGVGSPTDPGVPTLGDRVTVFKGAAVLGPVHVGDDAVIGAHALVFEDVPPGAVVKAAASDCGRNRTSVK